MGVVNIGSAGLKHAFHLGDMSTCIFCKDFYLCELGIFHRCKCMDI